MRLSYTKNGSGTEIIEENNYYPFGLKHQGYNTLTGNSAYKYQYNGKELQQETGWSDFGARMYMSDIGRWGVIDPLAETSRRFTPYNYAYNNPISFIDPDGRKAIAPSGIESVQPMNGAWGYALGGGAATFGSFQEFLDQQNPMATFMKSYTGGGGSRVFGETKAYRDLMAAYYRGGTGGLINKNGWLRWWTDLGLEDEGNVGTLNLMKLKDNGDVSWDAYKDWTGNSATAMEGMFKFVADQRTALYNKGYWIDNLGNQRSIAYAGRARGSLIGLRSDYLRGTAKFTKYAERAGMVGNVITAGEVTYSVYEDGWKFGKNAQVETAKAVGGIVGAAEGALIGAYIGSFVPGLGTVAGFVGGLAVGYIYSEIAGQMVENIQSN